VVFDPRLPDGLRSARFTMVHRGHRLRVVVTPDRVEVQTDRCATNPQVRIRVGSTTRIVPAGHRVVLPETPAPGPRPDRTG